MTRLTSSASLERKNGIKTILSYACQQNPLKKGENRLVCIAEVWSPYCGIYLVCRQSFARHISSFIVKQNI